MHLKARFANQVSHKQLKDQIHKLKHIKIHIKLRTALENKHVGRDATLHTIQFQDVPAFVVELYLAGKSPQEVLLTIITGLTAWLEQ